VFPAVQLVHVRNHGVAFGAFAGGGTIVLVLIAAALQYAVVAFWVL
jgi:signal peptidase II